MHDNPIISLNHRTENLINQTFGRLTVIAFDGYHPRKTIKQNYAYWRCICSCKAQSICVILAYQLKSGKTQSCGCLQRERTSEACKTHGLCSLPEYRVWARMIDRCENRTNKDYPNYGGRGILVCPSWRNNFEIFLADMGHRPTSQHSLERVDNNLGYNKNNVIWATKYEQSRNTRRTVNLTYQGKTLCLADWAKAYRLARRTLQSRIDAGWDIEKALTMPPRKR